MVAELGLEVAEELVVRGIDEGLGHEAEGVLGGGPQLLEEGLNTGFTVFRGRRSGRVVNRQPGCRLAVKAKGARGFPTPS